MRALRDRYAEQDLEVGVLEWRPPLNLTKRGLPGRDDEIAQVITMLTSMGRAGIPVWCYEWMTDFNWARTGTSASRGGSIVTRFDLDEVSPTTTPQGPISDEELWDNLEYFLRRVIPAAEEAGVRLAMHPDDPPLSPLRGVGRIMSSLDAYRRLIEVAPSEMNGITFCQGNFRLMTDDVPAAIREFGGAGRIFFVHFRDVDGVAERFTDTWHDAGPTDMYVMMVGEDVAIDVEVDPNRWLRFDCAGSRDGWRDMAAFGERQHDPTLRERLERAIEGKGAFHRFRDIVHQEGLAEQWYGFSADRQRGRARAFLVGVGIRVG